MEIVHFLFRIVYRWVRHILAFSYSIFPWLVSGMTWWKDEWLSLSETMEKDKTPKVPANAWFLIVGQEVYVGGTV